MQRLDVRDQAASAQPFFYQHVPRPDPRARAMASAEDHQIGALEGAGCDKNTGVRKRFFGHGDRLHTDFVAGKQLSDMAGGGICEHVVELEVAFLVAWVYLKFVAPAGGGVEQSAVGRVKGIAELGERQPCMCDRCRYMGANKHGKVLLIGNALKAWAGGEKRPGT
ncbi:hypothetical protein DL89DRAFT_67736 [Linderina pennispora]|uniref:Uncharacterized protein n=1 Tax=Linderina pennispora TaxID=61395 RepID=A0A1Y1VR15_9FUNG|nr:uncharacterized protein DL89DRAFT_67736 [Linderina pennispora]ORX63752.1 hypothetical protein DL89DRAFT_67736 [Linderina pennispora]